MRKRYGLVAMIGLILGCASHALARPNIIFILTDDQAPWALGLSGNKQAHTPNMDRLFGSGAYFINSFVTTPVCSPSRVATAASRYGTEMGITDWINPRKEPELGLDPDVVVWPELIQKAGYKTALIGKWHLGVPDPFHPTRNGFDEFVGFREGGTQTKDPTLEVHGEKKKLKGLTVDLLTNFAIEFIRKHRSEPFLLCLHHRAPHTRYLPVSDDDWSHYKNLDIVVPDPGYDDFAVDFAKEKMREYLASCTGIDRNLGRLLNTLDDLKLTDNTIVIYTSDHGYNIGHHGVWHKGNASWMRTWALKAKYNDPRRQRPNMFDTSIRVPTAIRWPGVVKPGTVIEETTSNLDWFPTVCRLAGVEVPKDLTIRGRDLVPLLKGEKVEWDNDLYCEFSQHHYTTTHLRAYRTPEWKLIRDFLNPGKDELYYLKADPDEAKNLIDSTDPKVLAVKKKLNGKLTARMWEIKDPVVTSPKP